MNTPESDFPERRLFATVFLVGYLCLSVELIQVRMLTFFLGGISNFLAIPIALFGLAIGSLAYHYFYKGSPSKLVSMLSAAAFPVLAAVFLVFFAVGNVFFNHIHVTVFNPATDVVKLIVFSALFLLPYNLFGMMLAAMFSAGSDRIGRLYFFDLTGAGLGCFVTPVLFTYTDLPLVILSLLFVALLLVLLSEIRLRTPLLVAFAVAFGVIQAMAFNGTAFKEKPDEPTLAWTHFHGLSISRIEEVFSKWNDLTRTSLLRGRRNAPAAVGGGTNHFSIVQDDGMSNVIVRRYNPAADKEDAIKQYYLHSMPFLLGYQPKKILVMFAGVGADMIALDALSDKKAHITGVEINPAVVGLAKHPALTEMNLAEFIDRKSISLVVREGRDFLNNDKGKYDFIFVATNGSVFSNRTGHTRKYLDTYEATRAYVDHLARGAGLSFMNQPVENKISILRDLSHKRDLADIRRSVFAFGRCGSHDVQNLYYKPTGFTVKELGRLVAGFKEAERLGGKSNRLCLYYAAGHASWPYFKNIVENPGAEPKIVTDDKPFVTPVSLAGFTLFPERRLLASLNYASNWIKLFTLVVIAFVTVLVIALVCFVGGRASRLPVLWLTYFMGSGIAYMCVEIGLIGKTELFLGSPLYAVAVILALFLMANGTGALLQDRFRVMRGLKTLIGLTTASIFWSIAAVELCNTYLLSIPLPLKILCVAVSVLPVGTCLGMYYPFGVGRLVAGGRGATIPATYSIATLSSVFGSSLAMTAIVNFGFSTIIACGAAAYALTAIVYLFAGRFTRAL